MPFSPVACPEDLLSLDRREVMRGFMWGKDRPSEPQGVLGRAFWHGWRVRQMWERRMPRDRAQLELERAVMRDPRFVS